MNEEDWEWFSVSDPHPYTVRTGKYDYEGLGRTTQYIRVDRQVCSEPVFKKETNQTLCKRKRLLDTSKYQPHQGKQECARRSSHK